MSAGDTPEIPARTGEEPSEPRARTLFRQGAVYGLAGALKAADVAVAAARGAVRGAREGVAVHEQGVGEGVVARQPGAGEGVAAHEEGAAARERGDG